MVMFSRDGEIESNMIFLLFNFNSDISFGSSCMALNDMVDVFWCIRKESKRVWLSCTTQLQSQNVLDSSNDACIVVVLLAWMVYR